MRVELNVLESGTEPCVSVQHQSALMVVLRAGSIEVGSRRSEMMRLTFGSGEMCLVPRHVETWLRTDDLHYLDLSVDISDAALAAASITSVLPAPYTRVNACWRRLQQP